MCLLFVSDSGAKKVSYDKFKNAWDYNSDGFGMMWAHNGRVIVSKTQLSPQKAYQMYSKAPTDRTVIGHFRFGTSGLKDIHNTHPFPLGDNKNIWLAHNGVFSKMVLSKPNMCDTWHFAQMISGVVKSWDELVDEESQKLVGEAIGYGNKVAFLNNEGKCLIFGHEQGTVIDDTWFSNTYSISTRQYGGHYRRRGGWNESDWDGFEGYGFYGGNYSANVEARKEARAELEREIAEEEERHPTKPRKATKNGARRKPRAKKTTAKRRARR